MAQPTGAIIEIIERGATTSDGSTGESVIVPDEIRINGQALAYSAEEPVIVHQVSALTDDAVRVTMTLLARRVVIAAESDVAPILTPDPNHTPATE